MDRDVRLEQNLQEAINNLNVMKQLLYSRPKEAYNILGGVQRKLDECGIALFKMANKE